MPGSNPDEEDNSDCESNLGLNFLSQEEDELVVFSSLQELLLPALIPHGWGWFLRTVLLTVVPMYILDLGLSYQVVGLLSAASGIGTVFGGVPAGLLSTRLGPRRGYLVEGAMYFLSAVMLSLPLERDAWVATATVSMVLAGFAETLGSLSRQTVLGAAVPAEIRGRAGSTLGGAMRAGSALGPIVGGLIAHLAGPQAAFLLQGSFGLAHIVWSLIFVPHVDATQDISCGAAAPMKSVKVEDEESLFSVARRHWQPLLRYSMLACLILVFRKSRELIFPMEGHARHLSKATVGSLASLSFLVDALGFPLAGLLMDGLGRVQTANLCLACGAVSFLVLAYAGPLPVLAPFAVMVGLANALSAGFTMTLGADIAPADCRAKFLAVYRTVGKCSDLIAPLILGILADKASMHAAVLGAASLCLFGVLWGYGCVEETLKRKPAAALVAAVAEQAQLSARSQASARGLA